MSEFRPHPLFYDALSGRFRPPFDPSHFHTLGRLANGTAEKGDGPEDFRVYIPSWANETSATLRTDLGDFRHILSLNETYKEHDPRILSIGHSASNAAMYRREHSVIIRTNEIGEEVHTLPRGGEALDELQLRIAGLAQQFYNLTAINAQQGTVSELYVPRHTIAAELSQTET